MDFKELKEKLTPEVTKIISYCLNCNTRQESIFTETLLTTPIWHYGNIIDTPCPICGCNTYNIEYFIEYKFATKLTEEGV